MLNTPRVPSNGLSHHGESYDLSEFIPEVQALIHKIRLVNPGISLEPILKRIAPWTDIEQPFYLGFVYLKVARRINHSIQLQGQYPITLGGKQCWVDFRFMLPDGQYPNLEPITLYVECDSFEYHDRTKDEFEAGRERMIELQQLGGKAYALTGRKLLKDPVGCVIRCVNDLRRDLDKRHEMILQVCR